MVRVRRSLIVLQVTAHTGRGGQVVVVSDMAIGALPWWDGVQPGQREVREVVVERCVRPRSRAVTQLASLRKAGGDVVRIHCALIILQMAVHAGGAGQVVVVVDVTVGALARRDGVAPRERKTGRAVIELGIEPGVGAMTKGATGGEASGSMTGIAGRFEIGCVTGVALRRHRLEPAGCSAFMTGVTIHAGMGAGQRKAIVMLLHLAHVNPPSANGMALLTVGSELAPVNVGVAVLAVLSNAGKYRLDVTLGARDGFMHAAQRIFRLVVIEFWNGADRLPRVCRVAVLARYVQISVRTVRVCRLRASYTRSRGKRQKQP